MTTTLVTSGIQFPDDTVQITAADGIPSWSSSNTYTVGKMVVESLRIWRCKVAVTTATTNPPSGAGAANWDEISPSGTSATSAAKLASGAWSIEVSGTNLLFKYGSSNVAILSSTGKFSVLNDVVAYAGATSTTASISPTSRSITGTVNTAISATGGFTATGFSGTVTYAVASGLPSGLSVDSSSGSISGTPTVVAAGTFTIVATGASSGTANASISYDIVSASGTSAGSGSSGTLDTGGLNPAQQEQ